MLRFQEQAVRDTALNIYDIGESWPNSPGLFVDTRALEIE